MKNIFKSSMVSYKHKVADTPYQKASQEWDERIGNAVVQAKNWRVVAIFSLLISIVLAITLLVVISVYKPFVYVAEVAKGKHVVNVLPLKREYHPTEAELSYFLAQFLEKFRSISLDPVVTKRNLMKAYNYTTGYAEKQFVQLMKINDIEKKIGKETVNIKILDVQAISANTFQANWQETVSPIDNDNATHHNYTGVFTLEIQQPRTKRDILANPLGIHIVSFKIQNQNTQ